MLFHYYGIDRSSAMIQHAEKAKGICGLFHEDSKFKFLTESDSLEKIPQLIENKRAALNNESLTVVINFSYIFGSHSLKCEKLTDFANQFVKDHTNDKICFVYQNPIGDWPNWNTFKRKVKKSLTTLSAVDELVRYREVTGRTNAHIRLHREILLNEKWANRFIAPKVEA